MDIDANNKKILNINLDRNNNNSAATVGMVKELIPHIYNNLYREIFERLGVKILVRLKWFRVSGEPKHR